MKTKPVFVALLVVCLVGALLASDGLAGKKKKKKPPAGPVVVGEDPAGDWGADANPAIAPIGDELGQDLVEATIAPGADATTVNMIIKVNGLPATGGVPEFTRYNWDITVDGVAFQVTGGFTEYLRGTCNPLHTNSCPPPQDPGMAPFFIRQGPCTVGNDCFVLGRVNGKFDAAAGTITIPVPLEVLEAKSGSTIGPGASALGPAIYAAPQAIVGFTQAPTYDTMDVTGTFTVP